MEFTTDAFGTQKMTCPYNESHQIISERFQSHLYKCRQNYPLTEHRPCKWNSCHDVPIPEYQWHLMTCVDRKKVDTSKFQIGEVKDKKYVPDIPDIKLPSTSNEWDDVNEPSYLDVKEDLLEEKDIFRTPMGITKSQKREFYQDM